MKKLLKLRYVCFLIIVAGFLFLLNLSWNRWGSPVVDTGREFWVPLKLSQGKVLYRDIVYFYGPLPPYVLAFLIKIFGVHTYVHVFTGITVTALSAILLYKIARYFLSEVFSTLVVLNFLFVFAFHYSDIFNYILPYSFNSTFLILCVLGAVYFFINYIHEAKPASAIFLSLWLTISFFCRLELALLVWGACAFNAALYAYKSKKVSLFLVTLSPLLFAFCSYYLFLRVYDAVREFNDSAGMLFRLIRGGELNRFFLMMSGLADMKRGLVLAAATFLIQLTAALLFLRLGSALGTFSTRNRRNLVAGVCISALVSAGIAVLTLQYWDYKNQYLLMPFVILLGLAVYFVTLSTLNEWRNNLSYVLVFTVSFVLILRIVLAVGPHRYGFYLAPLSIVPYYIFFVTTVPLVLKGFGKFHQGAQTLYHVALSTFFIILAVPFVKTNIDEYEKRNHCVEYDRGIMCTSRTYAYAPIWEAVSYMSRTRPNSTLFALPEGVNINFFSHRDNPTNYYSLMPPEVIAIGEEKIIRELADKKVEYIIIFPRKMGEYGYAGIGIDYGQKIIAWIKENYVLKKQIILTRKSYGNILIFRRGKMRAMDSKQKTE